MKNRFHFLIILLLLLSSCSQPQEQKKQHLIWPKIIEARGYVVPKNSVAPPAVILIGESKLSKVRVGKPVINPTNTNVHVAGKPKIVLAGTPKVCTPGQGSFLLPKIVSAIDSPFVAGKPEVVAAKDAYIKDQNPCNFISFNKLQGLKHSQVRCLLQDHSGNIWLGTYGGGVSKYDGKYFTHFTEAEGLTDNTVFSIAQDKQENLWLGTQAGAARYDGRSFTRFTKKEGLSDNRIYSILQERNGTIWFGTAGDGVIKYDGKSFTHFTEKEGLSNNIVFNILQDKSGDLWFATDGGGVSKYDGKSFTHFTEAEGLSKNNVLEIFQDRTGNLWFGTVGGGASKYDGKSFTHFTEEVGLSNNIIAAIQQDNNGDMWFGTDGGGLSKYDGKYFTHYTEKEGLSSNIIMEILLDKSSNLWLGTFGGGLSKYNGKLFTHITDKEGLGHIKVWCYLEDRSGNLWLGTYGGGASKYDGSSFTNYTDKEGLNGNRVASIIQDRKGDIWFGTIGNGVSKFDGKSFTHFNQKNGLSANEVYSIVEDRDGSLWFGTKGGVTKYDGKTFTLITKEQGLGSNVVFRILQDRKGNLWFATEGGIFKYDGKSLTGFTKREGLSDNVIVSVLEDQAGNLWFATYGNGIIKYDGKYFTSFTEQEGLSSNAVLSIAEDRSGNLWFGTRLGLSKLTPSSLLTPYHAHRSYFKTFGYDDGFLGIGCIRNSIFEDKTGTIWTGTTDRLTAFHPEGDKQDTIPPNMQLTNIELFNEGIDWGSLATKKDSTLLLGNGAQISDFEFGGLTRWYNLPEKLSLAYNNNYVSFNYIGITQEQSKKVRYQYKLEGADKNWSSTTDRTEASYSTLSDGDYVFKVKAVNSEGHWSNELHYKFTIRPPWWKTWWFRLIYGSAFAFALSAIYTLRMTSLKRRQKELQLKVDKATAHLKQKSEELTRANKELEQFAYVASHDLQEPLRTISSYAELVHEENAAKLDENSNQHLSVIIKATARMQNLIRDLLEFSKIGHQIKLTRVDCNEMIKEVMVGMSTSVKESGTKINFDHLPVLTGNETELKRLFQNLISNAMKFRKKNILHEIEISSRENDTEFLFAIKDNGIGIEEKYKDKIFTIFQRVDSSNKYPGTGIGLASCNKIINQHNGKIWVESKLGEGSTFYFTIAKSI